ncbi:MAG: tRNA pseudouridine(38-40) synthase TruA [Bacteroidales bacterium]|nr:tRNA pseudouridine(38-40) synthase TruA [Bacteroidales bacterium]
MPRYFIYLAYDGTAYHGWQIQPNGITVQQVLNDALSTVLRKPIMAHSAGRTDTGVHARQFYAHIDVGQRISSEECEQLVFSLNGILPKDIAVYEVFQVNPDMHARFSAISRTYEYIISRSKDPFLVNRAWFNTRQLDIDLMNQGAAILLEYNDFACFSKSNTQVKTYICSIMHARWEQHEQLLTFKITADRFLRNMVRAIVGTLTELGRGKISLNDLRRIIETGDRKLAGFSVPAEGLFLTEIKYPENMRIT